ncbi:hypothetical protein [Novacetimonas hansenii]|uniref:hypothetical protein n=1 Tax=Novacetimonas hansenii TaxID=436 RepID=UPI00248F204D|nr:hypothetical protein [Novacetimonas hansenii]
MDMIEPGRLIALLEDVKYRHYDSRQALLEVMETLGTVQHLLEDGVSEAMRRVSDATADLHDARQRVRRWNDDLDAVHAAAQSACDDADAQDMRARNVRGRADTMLQHWRLQLSNAVAARITAQTALTAAQGRKLQADTALGEAHSRLDNAYAALSACESDIRYDLEGRVIYPNCSGYSSNVYAAQSNLKYAQSEANNAAWALNTANQELNRAQGHEQTCTSRHMQAEHALVVAQSACASAGRAVAAARVALSCADDVYPLVHEMERLLVVTREHVNLCTSQASIARSRVDEGMQQFHTTHTDATTNGQDAVRMDDRLLEKVELMQKFDNRTL